MECKRTHSWGDIHFVLINSVRTEWPEKSLEKSRYIRTQGFKTVKIRECCICTPRVNWRIHFGFYSSLNMITAAYIEHRHRKHL
jgi:hypothetical protein